MEIFERLGAEIEEGWLARDRDDLAFAEVAERALHRHAVHEQVSYLDVIRWLNRSPRLPRQFSMDADFGQPPITVYNGDGWYIEALFWLEATTSVHRHAFAGAFQVLHGSSIQATWDFEPVRRISPRLSFGHVHNRSTTLLPTGAIQRIDPGKHLIHSVFHLEQPSLSLVVRTELISNHKPQFTYIRPHIEFDEWDPPDSIVRRLQALKMLWSLHHPAYEEEVAQVLSMTDLHGVLLLLEQDLALTGDFGRCAALLEGLRPRYGELVDLIMASAQVRALQAMVGEKRALLSDPDHRFFLAVVMNASSPASARELVKLRHPDRDPIEVMIGWVEALGRPRGDGQRIFDEIEVDEQVVAVLRLMLNGASAADLAGRLRNELPPELAGRAGAIGAALEASPLLRPLLRAD